jgi:hypothetical protein
VTTSTSKFASFTVDQFVDALKRGVRAVVDRHAYEGVRITHDRQSRGEHSYKVYVGLGQVYISINSSIALGQSVSRGCGEDAIRINLVDGISQTPVLPKQSYVKRIDTWDKNLEKRIESMMQTAHALEFCACGSPKREFVKKKDKTTFVACCGWSSAHHKSFFPGR